MQNYILIIDGGGSVVSGASHKAFNGAGTLARNGSVISVTEPSKVWIGGTRWKRAVYDDRQHHPCAPGLWRVNTVYSGDAHTEAIIRLVAMRRDSEGLPHDSKEVPFREPFAFGEHFEDPGYRDDPSRCSDCGERGCDCPPF